MPDDEAVGSAREAAVGDEGDVSAQPAAHDHGGGGQHFRHPGPTARTLVADDDHISPSDPARPDRLIRLGLAVEYARRALEALPLLAGDLRHGAALGHVAVEDAQVPGRLDRLAQSAHDLGIVGKRRRLRRVLRQRPPRDGHAVSVQETLGEEHPDQRRHAADTVQILHDVRAAGPKVG